MARHPARHAMLTGSSLRDQSELFDDELLLEFEDELEELLLLEFEELFDDELLLEFEELFEEELLLEFEELFEDELLLELEEELLSERESRPDMSQAEPLDDRLLDVFQDRLLDELDQARVDTE